MNKLLLVAAGVAGYVLGTKAGRERYEQIRAQSQKVWNSPTVQHGVDEATDVAKQAASAAGSKVADAASAAGTAVSEKVADVGTSVTETVSEAASSAKEPKGTTSSARHAGDALDGLADSGAQAVPDPAAPAPGTPDGPLPADTPTSPSVTTPPTAGDLDPNKNL